jgi:hypothetical protein
LNAPYVGGQLNSIRNLNDRATVERFKGEDGLMEVLGHQDSSKEMLLLLPKLLKRPRYKPKKNLKNNQQKKVKCKEYSRSKLKIKRKLP